MHFVKLSNIIVSLWLQGLGFRVCCGKHLSLSTLRFAMKSIPRVTGASVAHHADSPRSCRAVAHQPRRWVCTGSAWATCQESRILTRECPPPACQSRTGASHARWRSQGADRQSRGVLPICGPSLALISLSVCSGVPACIPDLVANITSDADVDCSLCRV